MDSTTLYAPLQHQDSVRLLRITPGNNGHGLEVTLDPFRLSSAVEFHALSYVWGSPTPQRSILCNGHRTTITPNLHSFLSQLRRQGFKGLLWADALCINQKDNEEKSSQVAMMRDIYSQATRVTFWLGEQQRYDELGARLMEFFFRKHPERPFSGQLREKSLDELGLPRAGCEWIGWTSLLQRPWFGRVWIVQEFLNAKESVFMSGKVEIPTKVLMHCASATGICLAIRMLVVRYSADPYSARTLIERPLGLVISQYAQNIGGKEEIRILDLWTQSRLLEATDPRDRVFALLSLQATFPMSLIDYGKDVAQVYTDIAERALTLPVRRSVHVSDPSNQPSANPSRNEPQRVSRFLACKHGSSRELGLPSWVPDWRPDRVKFIPLTRYFKGTTSFAHPYQHAVFEDKTMSISGFIVDRPCAIVDFMPPATIVPSLSLLTRKTLSFESEVSPRAHLNWQQACLGLAKSAGVGATKHELLVAFCRTLGFGALTKPGANPDAEYIGGLQALRMELLRMVGEEDRHADDFKDAGSSSRCRVEYESRFIELSAGRKFCITERKRLAWIPHYAGLGDQVCYLAGCAVPFVVRQAGEAWELLGDCYLSDMQDADLYSQDVPRLFKFR